MGLCTARVREGDGRRKIGMRITSKVVCVCFKQIERRPSVIPSVDSPPPLSDISWDQIRRCCGPTIKDDYLSCSCTCFPSMEGGGGNLVKVSSYWPGDAERQIMLERIEMASWC